MARAMPRYTPVRIFDPDTGRTKESIFDFSGRRRRRGLRARVRSFVGAVSEASRPDPARTRRDDWSRQDYERQIEIDRRAKAALARQLAEAVDRYDVSRRQLREALAGSDAVRPVRQRRLQERSEAVEEIGLTQGAVIRVVPGAPKIGVIHLGGHLHLVGEVPTVFGERPVGEIGAAMERAALRALATAPELAGPPGPWYRELPAPVEDR